MDTDSNLSDAPTLTDSELDALVATTLDVGTAAAESYFNTIIDAGYVPFI